MEPIAVLLVLLAVSAAFAVSAAAGFGGSLILVPALALLLDTKTGVALAALLLAGNNVVKIIVYRQTLPVRKSAVVVVLIGIGAAIGAFALVAAPERMVTIAVIVGFGLAFLAERMNLDRLRRLGVPVLALGSGATSGFSGTSGPLKGLAMRGLELDRMHLVGALSLASLVGDVTKSAIWTEAALISGESYLLALACLPLMLGATFLGRHVNRSIGERGYTGLFWTVMLSYTARLVTGL